MARRRMVIAVALLAFCALIAEAQNGDWPQFRGPTGQGVSDAKGLPLTWAKDQNVAWKTELPGAGSSTPIIMGGRIFLTCYTGYKVPRQAAGSPEELKRHVLCLDQATGKVVWDTPFAAELPEQDRIREEHGYASSTLAADAQRIYAFFGKSGVVALDHAGKELWRAQVGSGLNGWGSGASLALFEDLVLVNASVESQSLVALNKATGKEAWRAGGVKEAWNTPVVVKTEGGAAEIVVPVMQKVLAFDPRDGSQLWSCDTGINWYMVPCVVAHDGVVYCVGGRSGGALAVRAGGRGDVTGSHRVWTGKRGSNVTSPVYHDGHLYWMHENTGVAYCADAKTGNVLYEERIDRMSQVYAPAVLAEGRVYYVGRNGVTAVMKASPKFERLALNDLRDGSMFNAGPAVSGKRMYIRSERFLYALEEGARGGQ